ncbi:MAG: hypothetical protein VYB13_00995, partial [Chloroflexota bacterium]|nr:hypothetical protein [Chloroflexota bacterium]
RISTAIENGELTQDQVNRGITILKEQFKGPDRNLDFFYEDIKAGIAAAVESGEITQEEADAKLAGLEERKEKGKKRPFKGHHHKKPMMDIEDIKARISAAVESGEITQEEADGKLADIEAKTDARKEKMAAKLESIKADIAAAVESGEITQEEADAKLAGLEERKEKGKKRPGKGHHNKKPTMDIEDIKARISAAVESGEITQEEALDRFKREPKKITY